jgi:hypothetical protein
MRDRTLDQIVATLSARTQHVWDTAAGSQRHQRLTGRLTQLHGALELARRIESHLNALRRAIETD